METPPMTLDENEMRLIRQVLRTHPPAYPIQDRIVNLYERIEVHLGLS